MPFGLVGASHTCVIAVESQSVGPAVVHAGASVVGSFLGVLGFGGRGGFVSGLVVQSVRSGLADARLVGIDEVGLEIGPSLVGGIFVAPFVAGRFKDSGFVEGLEEGAHQGGVQDRIIAADSDLLAFDCHFDVGLDGCLRVPWRFEFVHVGLELVDVHRTIGCAEVDEDFANCRVGEADEGVLERGVACLRAGCHDHLEELAFQTDGIVVDFHAAVVGSLFASDGIGVVRRQDVQSGHGRMDEGSRTNEAVVRCNWHDHSQVAVPSSAEAGAYHGGALVDLRGQDLEFSCSGLPVLGERRECLQWELKSLFSGCHCCWRSCDVCVVVKKKKRSTQNAAVSVRATSRNADLVSSKDDGKIES